MTRRPLHELGSLQRSAMEIIWSRGEASVHQVLDALGKGRRPAYTTVLSVLQKLEKAGWLTHRKEGRTYVWSARRSREEEGRNALVKVIDRVFRGDHLAAFQHLLEDTPLDDADLAALRELIDSKCRERRRNA